MLASIEDGFSQLTTVQTSSEKNSLSGGETTAEIGSSNVFALLGVKLKGSLKGENSSKDNEISSQEKVHTPSSLFQKLREYLNEKEFGNPKYHECAVDTRKMGAVLNGDANCKASMVEFRNKISTIFNLGLDDQTWTYLLDQFISDIK